MIVPGSVFCKIMKQFTTAFAGCTRKIDGIRIVAEIKSAKFKKFALHNEILLIKMNVIKDFFRVLNVFCHVCRKCSKQRKS